MLLLRFGVHSRQLDADGQALANAAARPYFAAVPVDNLFCNGEP